MPDWLDEVLTLQPALRDALLGPTLMLGLALLLTRRARPALGQAILASALGASLVLLPIGVLARAFDLGFFVRAVVPGTGDLPRELWGLEAAQTGPAHLPLARLALALWIAASAALALRLARSFSVARGRVARLPELDPCHPAMHTVDELCATLGLRRPRIGLDHDRDLGAPVVWGLGRAKLVLQPELLELEPAALRAVLAHELAHLVRRDPWSHLLSQLACAVLPFHPLVWYARRIHGRCTELACDEWVVTLGCDGERYARTLLGLASTRGLALAPGLASGRGVLAERITRVLELRERRPALGIGARVGLVLASSLGATSLALARQRPPELAPPLALAVSAAAVDLAEDFLGTDVRVYPAVLDLGEVEAETERRGSLWIVNASREPRRVRGARPTCGCLTLSEIRDVLLAPGQAIELPLSMLATAPPGERAEKRVQVLVEGQPLMEAKVLLRTQAP